MARSKLLFLIAFHLGPFAGVCQTTTINNYSNVPYSIYNTPSQSFPSFSVPGNPTPNYTFVNGQSYQSANLPNSPSTLQIPTSQTSASGSTGQSSTLTQQVYPQPAQPSSTTQQGQAPTQNPVFIQLPTLPLQSVSPPDLLSPGLATIKKNKWTTSDYFQDLPEAIGVKVEILKPKDRYIPLSESVLEGKVQQIFQNAGITPYSILLPCEPPLPFFHITVMAYPCERRCIGSVIAQLYEKGAPDRIKEEVNGIWQIITWQRQTLVSVACEEFNREITETIEVMANDFADTFKRFHPPEERPCFDVKKNPYKNYPYN